MRRLLPFLGALMVAMMLWTGSAANAAEILGCVEVAADAAGHFEGDQDQVPSDPDKGTPHHHGQCHGHCTSVIRDAGGTAFRLESAAAIGPGLQSATTGCDPGTTLRPPIA